MVITNEVAASKTPAKTKAGPGTKSNAKAVVKAPAKTSPKAALAVNPMLVLVIAAVVGVGGFLLYKNRAAIKTALGVGQAARRSRSPRALLPARSMRPALEEPQAAASSHPDDPAFRRQLVDPMSPVTSI